MLLRWQILLRVPVLCVLLAGGVFAHPVQAQCCRHGGGMGGPSASVLQMLMQEQLLQQQQLLVQVQRQQMLQAKVLENQVRELAGQGPETLKNAFEAPQAEKRWVAALVAGEYDPALTEELIALLTDDNPFVRQAARQSLIRLSSRVGTREDKPGSGRRVDFGPLPDAARPAQQAAARKWRAWFAQQQKRQINLKAVDPAAPPVRPGAAKEAPSKPTVEEERAARWSKDLLEGTPRRREVALNYLRDSKGVAYTQALAHVIPQLEGDNRVKAREALVERLTRMSEDTLRGKLSDPDPEVRRAAALACAMKELKKTIPDLIALLEDTDPAVPPAARAALKNLTKEDFGAVNSPDHAEQTRVAAAWKKWWQTESGR